MQSQPILLVLLLFLGCSNEVPTKDLNSIKSRLEQAEKRLTDVEEIGQKVTRLESRLKKLDLSIEKLERLVASKAKARTTQKKLISQSEKVYHVIREGEILSRIANRYNISVEELCRLNHITPKTVIRPGQKLLIAPSSQQ